MTLKSQANEASYRKNKQQDLGNTLGNICNNIDWIWIEKSARRKVSFQIDMKNRLGFFAEKSHDLIEIDEDPLAEVVISDAIPTLKKFLKTQEGNLYTKITVTSFDNGLDVIFNAKRKLNFTQEQNLIKFAKESGFNISLQVNRDFTPLYASRQNKISYPDFSINLSSNIFIQASREGLENIIRIIKENLVKSSSKKVVIDRSGFEGPTQIISKKQSLQPPKIIDLYAGFGAYSFAIQGLAKSVLAVEGDEKMTNLITKNAKENLLLHRIKAETRDLYGDPVTARELNNFDIAIINPPRNGAETQIKAIAKSQLKKAIYVSCNPQSFLRDSQILIDCGFKVKNLCAIDQFYGTKHLELVATFEK
jgi:23S rRNA (uracil1939-C5)-methyltransferase